MILQYKQFVATKLFLTLQEASRTGIDGDAKELMNGYDEFVMLLFSENTNFTDKSFYLNMLVYARVEFAVFDRYREKNVAIYLGKALDLLDRRIAWIEKQLLSASNRLDCPFRKQILPPTSLKWTAKKTDLIELLYALGAAGCFNSGKASLNQIAAYFEKVFHTDLSHFPRDFYEMRIRLDQTPFMDSLKNLLKKRMNIPKKAY